MINVGIPGAAGRMGRELIRAIAGADDMGLAAATEASGADCLGQDAGTLAGVAPLGVSVTSDNGALACGSDGIIDFSAPATLDQVAPVCAERGVPLVVGTTGLEAGHLTLLRRAGEQTAVVFAPNMSVGVNLLFQLVDQAARLLGPSYHAEVVEAHHRHKKDAPSGTAARLVEILQAALDAPDARHGREGMVGERPDAEVGVHAVRGGDVVGEHTVMLLGQGERVELVHRASSRQTFAQGALRALRWASTRDPGLYDMQDVLGLR